MTEPPRADVAVFPTPDALMHAAAERFVAAAARGIAATGRFAVALAGGSTPRGLYALLATDAYAARVDWARVHAFWGDERCVPPDDPASNFRAARDALLAHVPIPDGHVHRVRGEDDPDAAAAAYEGDLRAFFATPSGPPRLAPGARFDLVLLGMGADGHTASLFPADPPGAPGAWAIAVQRVPPATPRVTLTPAVFDAAAEVVFLVAGRAKADTLRRVLQGPRRADALPAQRIAPRAGTLRWLVDASAAADLEPAAGSR